MNKKSLIAGAVVLGSIVVMTGCEGNGGTGEGEGAGGSSGSSDSGDGGKTVSCDHEVLPPTTVKAAWSKPIEDAAAGVAALPDGGIAIAHPDFSVSWGCKIAKLDASGNEVWSTVLSAKRLICDAIATDAAGNVYAAGSFRGQIDGTSVVPSFDDAEIVNQENSGMGSADDDVGDLFVVKLDSAGVVQFLHNFGSAGADERARLSVAPDGTSALTGRFGGGVSFGQVKQGTGKDVHVAGLGADGTVLWRSLIAADVDGAPLRAEALASGASGEVYLAAHSDRLDALILTRLDGGATAWRRDYEIAWTEDPPSPDASSEHAGPRLALGTDGNLIMAGEIRGAALPSTVDFGAGAITARAHVTSLSPAGEGLWSFGIEAHDLAIAIAPNGPIHLVGRAREDLFVGIPAVAVAAAPFDMFTAKLGQDGALVSAMVEISSEPIAIPDAIATNAAGADVVVGHQSTTCGIHFGHGELPQGGFLVSVQP